jgi:hypothetical protein
MERKQLQNAPADTVVATMEGTDAAKQRQMFLFL